MLDMFRKSKKGKVSSKVQKEAINKALKDNRDEK
jgi:hypothetical protein